MFTFSPDDFPWHSIKSIFKVYENKIKRLMFSQMFLVHLLKNECGIKLRHVRCAIAHAHLCTRFKLETCKKSMTCLIKKASRCVADCMFKTTFFISHFL